MKYLTQVLLFLTTYSIMASPLRPSSKVEVLLTSIPENDVITHSIYKFVLDCKSSEKDTIFEFYMEANGEANMIQINHWETILIPNPEIRLTPHSRIPKYKISYNRDLTEAFLTIRDFTSKDITKYACRGIKDKQSSMAFKFPNFILRFKNTIKRTTRVKY